MGPDGCSGQPLLWEKFPLLRSGCRVTHGFTQGKAGFEVKVRICHLNVYECQIDILLLTFSLIPLSVLLLVFLQNFGEALGAVLSDRISVPWEKCN